jgi:amidase
MLRLHYLACIVLFFLLEDVFAGLLTARDATGAFPDLYEASVEELQDGLDAGSFTSVDLIKVGSPQSHSGSFSKLKARV